MNRLNKTEFAIFVSLMCSLLPENLHSELILSSLQLRLCRVAAVKRLPVHHHSAGPEVIKLFFMLNSVEHEL